MSKLKNFRPHVSQKVVHAGIVFTYIYIHYVKNILYANLRHGIKTFHLTGYLVISSILLIFFIAELSLPLIFVPGQLTAYHVIDLRSVIGTGRKSWEMVQSILNIFGKSFYSFCALKWWRKQVCLREFQFWKKKNTEKISPIQCRAIFWPGFYIPAFLNIVSSTRLKQYVFILYAIDTITFLENFVHKLKSASVKVNREVRLLYWKKLYN